MKSIEKIFSDNEGNHLLVALNFYDSDYKESTLHIPPEFSDVEIVDIAIEKMFYDRPIHFSVFFQMSSWLVEIFKEENAIFSYTCSVDELETNHYISPQLYRKSLFDALLCRQLKNHNISNIDFEIGSNEYKTYGRAFFKEKHNAILYIVLSFIKDKYPD